MIKDLFGVDCLDYCREYGIASLAFNSFYCPDFCCGNCNFRYCCSNESFYLDQNKCTNTLDQQPIQQLSADNSKNYTKLSSKKIIFFKLFGFICSHDLMIF